MSHQQEQKIVDFSGLILGFSSAALSYLGYGVDGKPGGPINPLLAKQNIDIISLLVEKTQGNLTPEETTLVKQVMTDIMNKYAACCKKSDST